MSEYRPFDQYQLSAVDWLPQAPVGWPVRKIAWDMKVSIGWTPPTGRDDYYRGENCWVTIADLTGGKVADTKSKISDSAIADRKASPAPAGSVLFSYKLSVGQVAILDTPAYTNEAIAAFHPVPGILPKFWFYAAPVVLIHSGRDNIYGALLLNQESINGSRFHLPPIDQQRKIADTLDRETARIDALIEKKTRFIELLKEKRQALIHEALSHPETARMRLSHCTVTPLRPITRLDDEIYTPLGLYNRGRGIFQKPATQGKDLGDSKFSWVREGDLILSGQFSWEGAVALATDEHDGCVVSHRYHVYRGMPNLLDTSYLWAYFTSHEGDFFMNEHSRGSAGRNRPLNPNSLSKEKIPIPPMALQAEVAKLVSFEQRLKRLVDKSEALLNEHRSSLITGAVTGQIDMRAA